MQQPQSTFARYTADDATGATDIVITGYIWWKLVAIKFQCTAGGHDTGLIVYVKNSWAMLHASSPPLQITAGEACYLSAAIGSATSAVAEAGGNVLQDTAQTFPLADVEQEHDAVIRIEGVNGDEVFQAITYVIQGQRIGDPPSGG